tara:strand:+ start:7730 stop:8233 length:504 start_codon:yes stop_codon:yes gene_type:complete
MTIAFLVVLAMPSDEPYNTADHRHAVADLCIGSHSGIAEHYHPIVKITVLGEDVAIPDDVGLNDKGCNMRSLHTHSADGKIHAEFAEQGVAAPLEAFFDIWGKHMDSSGFHEHRIDDNHEFLMFLNTYSYDSSNNVVVDPSAREQVDDYEALILEDMQYIELIYKEK